MNPLHGINKTTTIVYLHDIRNPVSGDDYICYDRLVLIFSVEKLTVQIGSLQPGESVLLGQKFAIETGLQLICKSLRLSFCERSRSLAVVSFAGIVHIINVSDDNMKGEVIRSIDVSCFTKMTIVRSIHLTMNELTIVLPNHIIMNVDLETGRVLCLDKTVLTRNSTIQFGIVDKEVVVVGQKIEINDMLSKVSNDNVFDFRYDPQTGVVAIFTNSGKIDLLMPEANMLSGQFLGSIKLRKDDVLTEQQRREMKKCTTLCSFNMMCPRHINVLKPPVPFYPVSFFLDGNMIWFASDKNFCSVKFKFDRTEVVCLNRTNDDMTSLGQFRLLSIMRYGNLIVFTTGTHGYQIYDRETGEKICDLW